MSLGYRPGCSASHRESLRQKLARLHPGHQFSASSQPIAIQASLRVGERGGGTEIFEAPTRRLLMTAARARIGCSCTAETARAGFLDRAPRTSKATLMRRRRTAVGRRHVVRPGSPRYSVAACRRDLPCLLLAQLFDARADRREIVGRENAGHSVPPVKPLLRSPFRFVAHRGNDQLSAFSDRYSFCAVHRVGRAATVNYRTDAAGSLSRRAR